MISDAYTCFLIMISIVALLLFWETVETILILKDILLSNFSCCFLSSRKEARVFKYLCAFLSSKTDLFFSHQNLNSSEFEKPMKKLWDYVSTFTRCKSFKCFRGMKSQSAQVWRFRACLDWFYLGTFYLTQVLRRTHFDFFQL